MLLTYRHCYFLQHVLSRQPQLFPRCEFGFQDDKIFVLKTDKNDIVNGVAFICKKCPQSRCLSPRACESVATFVARRSPLPPIEKKSVGNNCKFSILANQTIMLTMIFSVREVQHFFGNLRFGHFWTTQKIPKKPILNFFTFQKCFSSTSLTLTTILKILDQS